MQQFSSTFVNDTFVAYGFRGRLWRGTLAEGRKAREAVRWQLWQSVATPAGAPEGAARGRPGELAVIIFQLTVHEDIVHTL